MAFAGALGLLSHRCRAGSWQPHEQLGRSGRHEPLLVQLSPRGQPLLGVSRSALSGVPDSRIVVMAADGMACDARNPLPGQVFGDEGLAVNVMGSRCRVDYRGAEVTAETLMRVLTGRHAPHEPAARRLMSDADSNVLLYLTGHGGDEFFKFQDAGEISSFDLADAFHSMHRKGRYRQLLVVADTCQASTLQRRLYSPDLAMVGSAGFGENSWSKGVSSLLGTTMADRFTAATLDFLSRPSARHASLLDLLRSYRPADLDSHPAWTSRLPLPLDQVPSTIFLAPNSKRLFCRPLPEVLLCPLIPRRVLCSLH